MVFLPCGLHCGSDLGASLPCRLWHRQRTWSRGKSFYPENWPGEDSSVPPDLQMLVQLWPCQGSQGTTTLPVEEDLVGMPVLLPVTVSHQAETQMGVLPLRMVAWCQPHTGPVQVSSHLADGHQSTAAWQGPRPKPLLPAALLALTRNLGRSFPVECKWLPAAHTAGRAGSLTSF